MIEAMPGLLRVHPSLFVCLGLASVLAASAVGCADKPVEQPHVPAPPPQAAVSAAAAPKRAVPAGHLRREDVMDALSGGPGAFLAKIEVEPVLDRDNKFRGWRVVEIRDPNLQGEHLAVGDVITAVNGRRIEREGEFYEAFMAMAFARELKVSSTRGGAPRGFVLPIDDDPNAPPIPLASATPTTAKPSGRAKRN